MNDEKLANDFRAAFDYEDTDQSIRVRTILTAMAEFYETHDSEQVAIVFDAKPGWRGRLESHEITGSVVRFLKACAMQLVDFGLPGWIYEWFEFERPENSRQVYGLLAEAAHIAKETDFQGLCDIEVLGGGDWDGFYWNREDAEQIADLVSRVFFDTEGYMRPELLEMKNSRNAEELFPIRMSAVLSGIEGFEQEDIIDIQKGLLDELYMYMNAYEIIGRLPYCTQSKEGWDGGTPGRSGVNHMVTIREDSIERLNNDLRVIRDRLKVLYNEYALEEERQF
jgi:hypothetical protein